MRPPDPLSHPLRLRSADDAAQDDPARGRYAKFLLAASTAGPAGTPLCDALAGRDPVAPAALDGVDGGGHRRPFYPGLLAHTAGLAARLRPGTLDLPELRDAHRARVWRDTNTYGSHAMLCAGVRPTAADAGLVAADVWDELALVTLGGDRAETIERVVARQDDRGTFFAFDADAGDNPEPWWYHEFVVLHAVATFAAATGDAAAARAAGRSAAFHHAETQPDHATSQPWALHAFLADPETLPTADLMLLSAGVNQPGGLGTIPRLLLADAAVWLLRA